MMNAHSLSEVCALLIYRQVLLWTLKHRCIYTQYTHKYLYTHHACIYYLFVLTVIIGMCYDDIVKLDLWKITLSHVLWEFSLLNKLISETCYLPDLFMYSWSDYNWNSYYKHNFSKTKVNIFILLLKNFWNCNKRELINEGF